MEAIIVEALMGVVSGAVIALITLPTILRFGNHRPSPKLETRPITETRTLSTPLETRVRRTRRTNANSPRTARPRSGQDRTATMHSSTPHPHAQARTNPDLQPETLNVCPSCGLQAPQNLMNEHFLGSPTHRNGRPSVTVEEDEPQWEGMGRSAKDADPSTLNLMRSLMHLLVPPRAFGLRGQERKGNPLDGIVKRSSILENFKLEMVPVA